MCRPMNSVSSDAISGKNAIGRKLAIAAPASPVEVGSAIAVAEGFGPPGLVAWGPLGPGVLCGLPLDWVGCGMHGIWPDGPGVGSTPGGQGTTAWHTSVGLNGPPHVAPNGWKLML